MHLIILKIIAALLLVFLLRALTQSLKSFTHLTYCLICPSLESFRKRGITVFTRRKEVTYPDTLLDTTVMGPIVSPVFTHPKCNDHTTPAPEPL